MPSAAAIYCRISQDRIPEDVRVDRGKIQDFLALGVKRQEKDCRRLCEQRGWAVFGTYVDNDVSAYGKKKRPEYDRMLEDIRRGLVDAVVVWHVDRLHRRVIDLEKFLEIVREAGIEQNLASCFGSYDLSNTDHLAMLRVVTTFAEKESDDKRRRISRKMEEMARTGVWKGGGTRPFGFEPDRVAHRPPEAKLVREAARRALAGESVRSICIDWNNRGVKTVRGGQWKTTILKQILVAPRTAGLRQHRGAILVDEAGKQVQATWKPILDARTFDLLRALLNDPNRNKRNGVQARRYLLTGLAVCGECGERLVARPRDRKTRCYVCSSGPDFGGCGRIRVVSTPVEEFVAQAVHKRLVETGEQEAEVVEEGVDEALLKTLRQDEIQLENLAKDHYVDRLISRPEYLAARGALDNRIAETKKELGRRSRPSTTTRTWRELIEEANAFSFDDLEPKDFEWWRGAIADAVEKVVVNRHPKPGQNFFSPQRVEIVWRR